MKNIIQILIVLAIGLVVLSCKTPKCGTCEDYKKEQRVQVKQKVIKNCDMLERNYKVVISETYKSKEKVISPLRVEKEKSEKKQKAKWLNLLLKINKTI